MYCVACTSTHDFQRCRSVLGEVLGRPRVDLPGVYNCRLVVRSFLSPCSLPLLFLTFSMICSYRGFIVNSWSSVTPRYLKVMFSSISIRLYCCVSPCFLLMYHLCILPSRLRGHKDLWNCTILVLSVFISMRAFSHHSWQKCSICWSWSGLSLTKTISSTNAIAPAHTFPVEAYVTALGNLV